MSVKESKKSAFALNSNFPRILTLLRKEKGYSQKKVASDLGISQALLSHYEKGIRECGLEFVVRAADYYDISCDYLLGRTPHRNGAVISVDSIPSEESLETAESADSETEYRRRILVNSINIIFAFLKKINSKGLTYQLSTYLSCAVYKAFRVLYSSNQKNPQATFALNSRLSGATIESTMALAEARSRLILSGESSAADEQLKKGEAPSITPESLTSEFPEYAPSLLDLIRNTEKAAKEIQPKAH